MRHFFSIYVLIRPQNSCLFCLLCTLYWTDCFIERMSSVREKCEISAVLPCELTFCFDLTCCIMQMTDLKRRQACKLHTSFSIFWQNLQIFSNFSVVKHWKLISNDFSLLFRRQWNFSRILNILIIFQIVYISALILMYRSKPFLCVRTGMIELGAPR